MTRSAFLSAGGDILLADFCLSLWKQYWYDEIDTMYVAYNNHAQVPLSTAYEFLHKWEKDKKVRIIYTPMGVGNGTPITQMLLGSKEDSLLLLEDDSFLFTPHIVSQWFELVETASNYVVGSPRYATGEVADAAKAKYHLDYSGIGDRGFGWWPSFFVCRREDLLKTDLDFGSKKYSQGEYFKELDHTFTEDCYTDTFTWASVQLRYFGLKSYDIPQNHTYPLDFDKSGKVYAQEYDDHEIRYLHGGSLSSGYGGYINKKTPPIETDFQKKDIETRVAFWKIVSDVVEEYNSFKSMYKAGIERLIIDCRLDRNRIQIKYNGYRRIMKI